MYSILYSILYSVLYSVPLQTEGVQSVSLLVLRLEQPEVGLPFVADNFATSKTPDWNDHFEASMKLELEKLVLKVTNVFKRVSFTNFRHKLNRGTKS